MTSFITSSDFIFLILGRDSEIGNPRKGTYNDPNQRSKIKKMKSANLNEKNSNQMGHLQTVIDCKNWVHKFKSVSTYVPTK